MTDGDWVSHQISFFEGGTIEVKSSQSSRKTLLWIKIRWNVLAEEEVQYVLAVEQYKYVQ